MPIRSIELESGSVMNFSNRMWSLGSRIGLLSVCLAVVLVAQTQAIQSAVQTKHTATVESA